MRLLLVELQRFRSRRAVVVVLLVAAALAALMAASTAYDTRPVSDTEYAAAEQALANDAEMHEQEYQRCLSDPEGYFGPGSTVEDCEMNRPQIDWYLNRSQLDLAGELRDTGTVLLVLLGAVAVLVGTTFSGADWASGSMSNQLLFEPRRWRVWLAKAVAVTVGSALAAAVVVAAFWGALALVAEARAIDTPAAVWEDIATTSARGVALAAAAALGGFALTMLMRHTVATLGLLFGYAVVGEGLAATLPFDKMSQWSLAHNVMAWVQDGVEVYDDSLCENTAGSCNPWYVVSLEHASVYLGVMLLLAVGLSLASFQRRDVP